LVYVSGVKNQVNSKRRRRKMSKIKFIILGYILAICFNGCDLSMSSNDEGFEVKSSGLGSSPYNPVYVRIVQ
jgi:hypothetical protein